jgi:lantibiotic leader peptide-processing serine protease
MKRSLFSVGAIYAFLIAILFISGCVDHTDNPLSPAEPDRKVSSDASGLTAGGVRFTGNYIVLSQNTTLPSNLERLLKAAGGTVVNTLPEAGAVIVHATDSDFADKAEKIRGVRSVIPDLVYQFDLPEPTEFVSIDALGDPPFSGSADFFFDLQWGHNAVRAHHAWAEGVRGQGVKVAVLDGGFDLTHPDLAPNINLALSANFVPGESLQYGLPDPFSHGSHVAGTIAAAENEFGIIGVAPDAELILVKVLGDEGSGSFVSVAAGIIHAANAGADIINMSLSAEIPQSGIPGEITASQVAELRMFMNRVIGYASQKRVTVIASAGNDALDRDKTSNLLILPADMPNVITISATAPVGWATDPGNIFLDNLASYSNYGRSSIDFAAPGGDYVYPGDEACTVAGLLRPCWVFDLVFSTGNGGWYWSVGTSMAAPHAAGIAALIISEYGGSIHPSHVETELRRRADRLGSGGRDPYYGLGRVNSGY